MNPNLDVSAIRADFPALHQQVFKKPLVYLDNAATTQKPKVVIERLQHYYELENSNIHRGVHHLSQQATVAFEQARKTIAELVHAANSYEIIFTRGTTESVNLVASSLGRLLMKKGDHVLVTAIEHHSNMVPWQQLCEQYDSNLLVARFDQQGVIDLEHYQQLLEKRPKIVAIAHISNALGTINPVKEMISMAHKLDIPVLVDGAQSIAHCPIDVQDLDCDFYAFSAHKAYGPMGIGVLYGKEKWLEKMPPYQFGGEMVDQVSFEKTSFNCLPFKFEAGTPNVGGVLGMETAMNYILEKGYDAIAAHENALLAYATQQLKNIEGLRIFGESPNKASVISFLVHEIHPFDLGTLLDKMGIALRTGHHCAQPIMDFYNIPGTVRASFAMYNTFEEVDVLIQAIKKASAMLR
ncbi:MAG: cysteine desulfurase / selenocysteine lyase [Bacteroidetes bacterium]|nr:MAG: cysteine desulfurase / selenocysteine lyase [Bacteroidota bacterium]